MTKINKGPIAKVEERLMERVVDALVVNAKYKSICTARFEDEPNVLRHTNSEDTCVSIGVGIAESEAIGALNLDDNDEVEWLHLTRDTRESRNGFCGKAAQAAYTRLIAEQKRQDRKEALSALMDSGMSVMDIIEAVAERQIRLESPAWRAKTAAYLEAAKQKDLGHDNTVDFDDTPIILEADRGARLLAWVWVGDEDMEEHLHAAQ